MSESEFKKIRRHLRLLTICVLLLIALLGANLVHRNFSPKSTSFPKTQVVQGKPGKDATVNYGAIERYVDAKVASLPKPQNGINGQNGQSVVGPRGSQGIPGKGVQGITGAPGEPGANGQDGIDGLTLQVRVNPVTCQLQDKYTISAFWITIAQLPIPCEAQ